MPAGRIIIDPSDEAFQWRHSRAESKSQREWDYYRLGSELHS